MRQVGLAVANELEQPSPSDAALFCIYALWTISISSVNSPSVSPATILLRPPRPWIYIVPAALRLLLRKRCRTTLRRCGLLSVAVFWTSTKQLQTSIDQAQTHNSINPGMAYCGHLDYQSRTLWQDNENKERYQPSDLTLASFPMNPWPSPEHSAELMDRYFQERDRPLFEIAVREQDFMIDSFPGAPLGSMRYTGVDGTFDSYRYPSPTNSGRSSLVSSDTSDCALTPWSQPDQLAYSPESVYVETVMHMDGHACYDSACVALPDVQAYADSQPEKIAFHEDEHLSYGAMIQEGYQPVSIQDCHDTRVSSHTSKGEVTADMPPGTLPVTRRRRAASQRAFTPVQRSSVRVVKGSPPSKRASISTRRSSQDTSCTARAFPCPFAQYGCQSTFGSKNEWKRHTSTQHMRFGFWRCDQCSDADRKPNDFNRKDLFVQHVRRMHLDLPATAGSKPRSPTSTSRRDRSEDDVLNSIADRCHRRLRAPPKQSGCTFCPMIFTSWDERMEHVGRHLETARKQHSARRATSKKIGHRGIKEDDTVEDTEHTSHGDLHCKCDEDTELWLLSENLLVRVGKKLLLTNGHGRSVKD